MLRFWATFFSFLKLVLVRVRVSAFFFPLLVFLLFSIFFFVFLRAHCIDVVIGAGAGVGVVRDKYFILEFYEIRIWSCTESGLLRRSEKESKWKWVPLGLSSVSLLVMVLLERLVSWFLTPVIPSPRSEFLFFFYFLPSFFFHIWLFSPNLVCYVISRV